jgi:hypothetical protein
MKDKNINELDLLKISEILNSFEQGEVEQRVTENLLRFTEYNKGCLESRIGALWGKEHTVSLYTCLIKGFEISWRISGDFRFLNIILKLSRTKFFQKLQNAGHINNNIVKVNMGEVK